MREYRELTFLLAGMAVFLALVPALLYGWVANIISLMDATALGETIVRAVGIPLFLLGAILGLFF